MSEETDDGQNKEFVTEEAVSRASADIEMDEEDNISEAMTTIQLIIMKAPEFHGKCTKFFGWEMEFTSYTEEKGFAASLYRQSVQTTIDIEHHCEQNLEGQCQGCLCHG